MRLTTDPSVNADAIGLSARRSALAEGGFVFGKSGLETRRLAERGGYSRAAASARLAAAFLLLAAALPGCAAAGRGAREGSAQGPQAGAQSQQGSTAASEGYQPSVTYGSFHSEALGGDLNFGVLLPPSYAKSAKRRFPVLYFLHGMFGTEREFERRGVAALVEKMEREGTIGEMIVVTPAGKNSFYMNSKNGVRYEDAIVKDLIPYIESTYRVEPGRNGRAIQGISMGGFGALMIAFKHPEMFTSVATHSAALFAELPKPNGGDPRSQFVQRLVGNIFGDPPDDDFFKANNPLDLAVADLDAIKKSGLKIYFDCGEQDRYGFQRTNQLLDQKLTALGVAHEFHIYPGGHGWDYMLSVADHSYEFLWKGFDSRVASRGARKG